MSKKTIVHITENFERNLDEINSFLAEQETGYLFEPLLDNIFDIIIKNLEKFPLMGSDFLARRPLSVEGRLRYDELLKTSGSESLREYISGDYLVLYTIIKGDIYLLSIKHHRQLSFDLKGFW